MSNKKNHIRSEADARAYLDEVEHEIKEVTPGHARVTTYCYRCGGSGSYSFNMMDGTKCYGCGGSGGKRVRDVPIKKYAQKLKAKNNKAAKKLAEQNARVDEAKAADEAARLAAPVIYPAVKSAFPEDGYIADWKAFSALVGAHPACPGSPGKAAKAVCDHHRALMKEERELEKSLNPSKPLAKPGDRIEVLAKLVWHHYLAGDRWGSKRILKFEDAEGNKVTVFDSYRPAFSMIPTIPEHVYEYDGEDEKDAYGRWYAIKGTVKKHDDYKGEISTVLIRCKAEQAEAPQLPEPEIASFEKALTPVESADLWA